MHGAGSRSSRSLMVEPQVAENWAGPPLAKAFSPEFRFLLACCVWPHSEAREQQLPRVLQSDLDWNYVLRLTERHRVAGLVFDALNRLPTDAVPECVRKSVAEKATSLARENLQLAGESARIARLMQGAGVPVAFLKGAPVAMIAYGNLSLRHGKDIDLLVSQQVALPAHRVLLDAGYQGATPAERMTKDAEVERWFRDNRHIEYLHRDSGINVELHVRMFANPLLNQAFGPECWESLPLGGTNLVSLKRQELVLYLCLHGALHGWFRLKWLADIGALLSEATETQIGQLLQAAESLAVAVPVAQALQLSSGLLGTPREMPVAPAWRERWLTRIALREIACDLEPGPNFRTAGIRLCPYLFRSDWRYLWLQIRCDSRSEADRQLLPLPKALSFLYQIIRPFTWAFRRLLMYCGILSRGIARH